MKSFHDHQLGREGRMLWNGVEVFLLLRSHHHGHTLKKLTRARKIFHCGVGKRKHTKRFQTK